MANVNAADLERLGITREQWDEQQARFDAEQPLEVRVIGGHKALREALKAAGVEFWITHHAPESWHECKPMDEWCGGCYVQYDDGLHHHGKPHEHD